MSVETLTGTHSATSEDSGDTAPSLVLEVNNVSVAFGGVQALKNVSLSVAPGGCRGIIGPNGAGKTTLFEVISGFTRPGAGQILLNGTDITSRSVLWRSRNGVRRTFQRQQVFGGMSVEDNLLAALEWHGGGGGAFADLLKLPTRTRLEKQRRVQVDETLELCGLLALRNQQAGTLSIGQARMLEFARALVDPPALLLVDEPTSGMEAVEIERMSTIFTHLKENRRCGLLLIEHDITFVMEHSDRVSVLNLGEVLAEGTPAEIQSNDSVRSAYLG